MRASDTVCGLSGDEFTIVVEKSPRAAADVADRVVKEICQPLIIIAGHTMRL